MGSNSGPIAISHIQSAIDPLEQGHEEKTCSGDSAHYNIPKKPGSVYYIEYYIEIVR